MYCLEDAKAATYPHACIIPCKMHVGSSTKVPIHVDPHSSEIGANKLYLHWTVFTLLLHSECRITIFVQQELKAHVLALLLMRLSSRYFPNVFADSQVQGMKKARYLAGDSSLSKNLFSNTGCTHHCNMISL